MISVKRLCRILLVEAVAWLTCIYTSTTTTTSGGRLYTHSFGPSGIDMCTLDSPSTTLPLGFSLARCAVECNRLSGCKWFNYFTNQTNGVACQLYTSPPLTLDMTSGCALHSVSFSMGHHAKIHVTKIMTKFQLDKWMAGTSQLSDAYREEVFCCHSRFL